MEEVTELNQLDVINFTNIDSEDFEGMFGGNPTTIKAGETRQFPRFLAQHFTKHLIDKILLRDGKDHGSDLARNPLEAKILGIVVSVSSEVVKTEPKTEEFPEVPQDEVHTDEPVHTDETGFKGATCGKVLSSNIARAGHSRSHK